ncbi:MAG: heavy-metal-associated domain-containing protein [Rikenellaceae bacterium]
MKKIILLVVAMVMTFGVAESYAGVFSKKTTTTLQTQFITNIDCNKCVTKIMNYVPHQKGISEVKVDLPQKIVTVNYDKSKSSNSAIIKHFKKIDVQAKVYVQPQATPSKTVVSTPSQDRSGVSTTNSSSNSSSNNSRNSR